MTKIPQTGGLINNRHGLLSVLKAGSPRSRLPEGLVSDQTRPIDGAPLTVFSHGEEVRELSGVFYRNMNPIPGAPSSVTHLLPKTPTSSHHHLGG